MMWCHKVARNEWGSSMCFFRNESLPSSRSSPGRHTLLLGDLFHVSNVLGGDQDVSELGILTNPMPPYDTLWYNDQPTFACISVYLHQSE